MTQGSGRAHAGIGQQKLENIILPDDIRFSVTCQLLCPEEQHASGSDFVLSLVQLAPLQSVLEGAGLKWRIAASQNRSTSSGRMQLTAELKSPLLKGREGCDEVFKALNTLKLYTTLKVDRGCSLCIRVGPVTGTWNPNKLKTLLCNFIKLEGAFDKLMPPSRRNSSYCKSIRQHLGGTNAALLKLNACSSLEAIVRTANPNSDCCFKVNLEGIVDPQWDPSSPGLLEFRQAAASQNPAKILGFTVLFLKFVEYSFAGKTVSTSANEEAEFTALLDLFHDVLELKEHFLPKRRAQVESNEPPTRRVSSGTSSAAPRAATSTGPSQAGTTLGYVVAAAGALQELWSAERAAAVRSRWGSADGPAALDQHVQAVAAAVAAIASSQQGSFSQQQAIRQALRAAQELQGVLGGRLGQPVMLALANHLTELLSLMDRQQGNGTGSASSGGAGRAAAGRVSSSTGTGRGRGRPTGPSGTPAAGAAGGRGGAARPGRGGSGSAAAASGTAGGAGVMQLLGRTALQALGRLSAVTSSPSSSCLQLLRAMRAAVETLAELSDITGSAVDGLLGSIVPPDLLQMFQEDGGGVLEIVPDLISAVLGM